MRRRTRDEYEADYIARADEAFATHVLAYSSRHARWTIRREDGRGFYATDLLWLPRGFWLIHGDIAAVLILTRDGHRYDRLDWIGNSHPDYIAEKVGEAMRLPDLGFTYDSEVAAHELVQMIDEAKGVDRLRGAPNAWVRALGRLEDYGASALDVMRGVWEDTGDHEFSIGRVVNGRVYYAQAAARCLLRLLEAAKPKTTGDGEVVTG